MLGIRRMYTQLMGTVMHGACNSSDFPHSNTSALPYPADDPMIITQDQMVLLSPPQPAGSAAASCKLQVEALTMVFGMDKSGRIEKKKACEVVKRLGLVNDSNEPEELLLSGSSSSSHDEVEFDLTEKELEEAKMEVLREMEREEALLRQAFMVFDEDGDGYIDAKEIKRVLVCLGLDNGWGIAEIEKMIRSVDLNRDGKIDFHEFELMMMGGSSSSGRMKLIP